MFMSGADGRAAKSFKFVLKAQLGHFQASQNTRVRSRPMILLKDAAFQAGVPEFKALDTGLQLHEGSCYRDVVAAGPKSHNLRGFVRLQQKRNADRVTNTISKRGFTPECGPSRRLPPLHAMGPSC